MEENLKVTNITKQQLAVRGVVGQNVLELEVVSNEDVYCMDVPNGNSFVIRGGLVSHNCLDASRYAVMTGIARATVFVDGLRNKMNNKVIQLRTAAWS